MRNPEDRPHRHREELPLVRVRRTGLPPVASPHATSACRVCCTSSPSVAATGSYARLLTRLAKLDLLAIDDWMIAPLRDTERRDLTEVIEDRAERASTLIASQLPVTDWHAVIGDANQADAICDRLLHDAHRIELKGRSMRRTHRAPKTRTPETA